MARRASTLFRLLGLGFAVAGGDKLIGDKGYRRLFRRHWGWSEDAMRLTGLAELVGGLLVMVGPTRRVGGAILTATSAAVLSAEVRHSDAGLALPRLILLLASAAALRVR